MPRSGIGLPKGMTVDQAYIQGISDAEDMMSTKTEPQSEPLVSLDFSEVEWKVLDSRAKTANVDYGALEVTQALLRGDPVEVPLNTETSRLYRFLRKQGYSLRKRTTPTSIVLWTVEA